MSNKQPIRSNAKFNIDQSIEELRAVLELIDKMRNPKDEYAQYFDTRYLSIAYTSIEDAILRLERSYRV